VPGLADLFHEIPGVRTHEFASRTRWKRLHTRRELLRDHGRWVTGLRVPGREIEQRRQEGVAQSSGHPAPAAGTRAARSIGITKPLPFPLVIVPRPLRRDVLFEIEEHCQRRVPPTPPRRQPWCVGAAYAALNGFLTPRHSRQPPARATRPAETQLSEQRQPRRHSTGSHEAKQQGNQMPPHHVSENRTSLDAPSRQVAMTKNTPATMAASNPPADGSQRSPAAAAPASNVCSCDWTGPDHISHEVVVFQSVPADLSRTHSHWTSSCSAKRWRLVKM